MVIIWTLQKKNKGVKTIMHLNLVKTRSHKFPKNIQSFILLMISLAFVTTPAAAQPFLDPPIPESPEATSKIYLPMTMLIGDLYVSNIEITQAVQNISDPVSLVANRTTLVRVYARTSKPTSVSNLQATLTAYRGSSQIGKLTLSGGSAYPASSSLDSLRASSSKSFNFQLPSSWITAGSIKLVADLDTLNVVRETNEVNTLSQNASFISVPVLNIMAVPVTYYHRDTWLFPAPSTSWIQEALYRMYPVHAVNVSVHSAYDFWGNLNDFNSWEGLLDEISDLKDLENQPESTVYYGVIPLLNSYGDSWFDGAGVVGYGWVGWRAAIGVTKETIPLGDFYWLVPGDDYAAHEIGHNLGRLHAPCGSVKTYDPYYLYPGGVIGQYGFKVSQLPSQIIVDKTWTDIMGYCDNQWISDYTYEGLYLAQLAAGSQAANPMTDSIYVRVGFEQDGAAIIKPIYGFNASPSNLPKDSEYTIQFLDSTGNVLAEYPVSLLQAEEQGYTTQSIRARLPLPASSFSAMRLVKSGQVLAERGISSNAMSSQEAPDLTPSDGMLTLSWPASGQPALLRYTADGGISWVILGVDIQDSELKIPLTDLPTGSLRFQIILADGGGSWSLDYTP